jgi:serine/threonine-protein kinase HipA
MRVRVLMDNTPVGQLADIEGTTYFEFDAAFIQSNAEISPLHWRLVTGARACRKRHLHNLPGFCYDSLPDAWGERIMARWFLAEHKKSMESVTPLEQLCFVGDRGVGALRYEPVLLKEDPLRNGVRNALDLRRIEIEARAVLEAPESEAIPGLIELARNGSAGGARPKIWIGVKERSSSAGETRLIASSHQLPVGYTPWLLKLDVPKVGARYREYGRLEHAYALMAKAAGLRTCKTRIFTAKDENGHDRSHFAIARFDRGPAGKRIYFHSLAGITESDFDADLGYELLLDTTQEITRDHAELVEAFRRASFNVAARVRDDHAKNHGFLYEGGRWRLSPAYDMVYASPGRFQRHAMSIGGSVQPGVVQLQTLASYSGIDAEEAAAVMEKCRRAVMNWRKFAAKAGVSEARQIEVEKNLPGRSWDAVPVRNRRTK